MKKVKVVYKWETIGKWNRKSQLNETILEELK